MWGTPQRRPRPAPSAPSPGAPSVPSVFGRARRARRCQVSHADPAAIPVPATPATAPTLAACMTRPLNILESLSDLAEWPVFALNPAERLAIAQIGESVRNFPDQCCLK